MSQRLLAALIGSTLVAGCTPVPTSQSDDGGTAHASIAIKPIVRAGGYAVQAEVANNTLASIQKLELRLFTVGEQGEQPLMDGNQQIAQILTSTQQVSQTVKFTNLRAKTTYRVKAIAYGANDAVINREDPASFVDIPVVTDDSPVTAELKIQLDDVTFAAAATTSIVVSDGGWKTVGPATVSLQP